MAESPPPGAAAESCGEDPERGGERRPEEPLEPRGAAARGADREGEAGPSEPDSPVAAPFFLLYPGDGGAGFTARPPPQRAWRTPPSPGSPLPFLLLSYPSGGSGGGGKHRECRARAWGHGDGDAVAGGAGRAQWSSAPRRVSEPRGPGVGSARGGGGGGGGVPLGGVHPSVAPPQAAAPPARSPSASTCWGRGVPWRRPAAAPRTGALPGGTAELASGTGLTRPHRFPAAVAK